MSATTISLALEVLLSLLAKTQVISDIIRQANSEGRDELTPEEWSSIMDADESARQRLVDAIAAKREE